MHDAADGDERRKEALRRLLATNNLPFPDGIYRRENGETVCLWHEPRVALVIADDEPGAATVSPQAIR
jgi:hypothetical protein